MYEDELITVAQFGKKYPWPSVSALRAYIFREKEYGLEGSFIHFGNRVLINPKIFFNLIKSSKLPCTKGHKKEIKRKLGNEGNKLIDLTLQCEE